MINFFSSVSLFENCSEEELKQLSEQAETVNFAEGSLILREGELADALYIIVSGSVQVFTLDKNEKLIVLARLDKKKCFGEQAYLNNLIRSANVRALTEVQLLKIHYDLLDALFKKSPQIRSWIEKTALGENLQNFLLQSEPSLNAYLQEVMIELLNQHQLLLPSEPNLNEKISFHFKKLCRFILFFQSAKPKTSQIRTRFFRKDEIIFEVNSSPDFVYLLTSGTVAIIFEVKKGDGSNNQIIMNKNRIFGEIGVLNNVPRTATAVATTSVIVIEIPAAEFLLAVRDHQKLKSSLLSLNEIYALPKSQAIVEQFTGPFEGTEAIYTQYKFPDGAIAECVKVINQPIFTMKVVGMTPEKILHFKQGLIERKISLKDQKIVEIMVVGDWSETHILCEMLLSSVKTIGMSPESFEKTGNFLSLSSNSVISSHTDIICQCMSVNYQTIKKEIGKGNKDLKTISTLTGACSVCGTCKTKILDILGQSSWSYAKIEALQHYNDETCSFKIKPVYCRFPQFMAGQFISLKLLIDGLWVERSYTLVSYTQKIDEYEIMIKKHANGTFSSWLFSHVDAPLFVWISQPSGHFLLKPSEKPILCFAGGIGITPFIAYIRDIKDKNKPNHLFILYSVKSADLVSIPNDVTDFLKTNSQIKLDIWDTSVSGRITPAVVQQKLQELSPEYVYLCGSPEFMKGISESLIQLGLNPDHIVTEQFLPAAGSLLHNPK